MWCQAGPHSLCAGGVSTPAPRGQRAPPTAVFECEQPGPYQPRPLVGLRRRRSRPPARYERRGSQGSRRLPPPSRRGSGLHRRPAAVPLLASVRPPIGGLGCSCPTFSIALVGAHSPSLRRCWTVPAPGPPGHPVDPDRLHCPREEGVSRRQKMPVVGDGQCAVLGIPGPVPGVVHVQIQLRQVHLCHRTNIAQGGATIDRSRMLHLTHSPPKTHWVQEVCRLRGPVDRQIALLFCEAVGRRFRAHRHDSLALLHSRTRAATSADGARGGAPGPAKHARVSRSLNDVDSGLSTPRANWGCR